ncbi:hypothetical protein F4821DRAFT_173230 [Hypoxylon rubiginosum]|uniref:Uncharacterized protein n=1 Tax=Hypoxylon rubiginosum TaxID=110542 RepID=A0ACC0DGM5_9PEZI|nr:hypothetical protein F4821DRAFT_173230 [Hypoxylon rubiginosum]
MTAVTKTTRGLDGVATTLTYVLPAQTTPFAPARQSGDTGTTGVPAQCAISVLCRGLTYAAYASRTAAHDPNPLDGQQCLGVQGTSAAYDGSGYHDVGYETNCWPVNYFALFDEDWSELTATTTGAPRATTSRGDTAGWSTAAFPGGNCLAGWTTACTTTVTAGAEPLLAYYPQAWCCPPGQWTCATATADNDRLAPQRLCRSLVLESTQSVVWMSFSPPFRISTRHGSTDDWEEYDTWKALVPSETDPAHAATVFRKVFPLVLSSGGGSSGGGGGGAVMAVETAEAYSGPLTGKDGWNERSPPPPPLVEDDDYNALVFSRGAVAGFLGAAMATVVMSLLGFALWRRARRGVRRSREVAAVREDGKYDVEILLKPEEVKLA